MKYIYQKGAKRFLLSLINGEIPKRFKYDSDVTMWSLASYGPDSDMFLITSGQKGHVTAN